MNLLILQLLIVINKFGIYANNVKQVKNFWYFFFIIELHYNLDIYKNFFIAVRSE